MNINEDKFANKSAEEIISDMLTQHKNNSKEALEHIQDILKDDGLTLGDEAKANLEKAATILSDKGLKEGWFSKDAPKKYAVKFEVYLPFKKEPAQFQIPPVASLNDPLVKETLAKIRARHPKSTIYIRSELGDQRITEDSKKAPKKNQGGLLKQFFSSDVMKHLAAIGATAATGINPIIAKQFTDIPMNRMARKFENVNREYQVNLYKENANYTCYAGNLGIALALAEKASEYNKVDILKENKVICSYDRSLKEWSMNTNENELKEDLNTFDDLATHSYADLKKDIANIDERLVVIDCGLNPYLIDKRKPKFSNIFGEKEYVSAPNVDTGEDEHNLEVLVSLHGIEPNVNPENPDNTEVTLIKKIPYRVTEKETEKGIKKLITYKDGEIFTVTVGQFKKLLRDPENVEPIRKFQKKKGHAILTKVEQEEFRSLDEWAKKAIDSEYPEWEAAHEEEYNLGIYSLPERAKIYQAWKDRNRTNMYQQARELTPEEVDKQFGLDKLKSQLKTQKDGAKLMVAYDTTRKAIPADDQVKLDNELLDILNNSDEDTTPTEIRQIIGYYGAKNQLNQLSKGKLLKVGNDLPAEDKDQFTAELDDLITNKYLDINTGLPKVVQKAQEAMKDVNSLLAKFTSATNSSSWNQEVGSIKEIGKLTTDVLDVIKEIEQINPAKAKDMKDKLVGAKNSWRREYITGKDLVAKLNEFLQYTKDVKHDELQRSSDIANIKAKYGENPTGDEVDNREREINSIKNKAAVLPEKERQHNDWMDMLKHIEDPSSKAKDKTYYTAITNKISRLIKNDPQAANGYHNQFEKMLKDLEAKYPEGNEAEMENALYKFLETLKDETKADGTVTGTLRTALQRKLDKLA